MQVLHLVEDLFLLLLDVVLEELPQNDNLGTPSLVVDGRLLQVQKHEVHDIVLFNRLQAVLTAVLFLQHGGIEDLFLGLLVKGHLQLEPCEQTLASLASG